MLEVQRYLSENPIERLTEEFGVIVTPHDTLPLVILNYSQIDSHHMKYHEIVRECRGLCLEIGTWRLVGRGFPRFYNAGEYEVEQSKFNWNNFVCQEKADGSLLILYYYNGKFCLNTRGSFAQGIINGSSYSWESLFMPLIMANGESFVPTKFSCVFEGMSPYNQVVVPHPEPKVSLLTIFNNESGKELPHDSVDIIAEMNGWSRPKVFNFSSQEEILEYFTTNHKLEEAAPNTLFEGVVVRDSENQRIKIKTQKYIALHRAVNNGNVFLAKNLIPLILNNEIDELLVYYPSMKPQVDAARAKLRAAYLEAKNVYDAALPLTCKAQRGKMICGATKLTAPVFTALNSGRNFDEVWAESDSLLVKQLFE